MRRLIRLLLPNLILNPIRRYRNKNRLRKEYEEDYIQFSTYSFVFGKEKTKRHYEAELIFFYHKIEKGLAMPEPKVGFGKKNVEYLVKILKSYIKKYGWDQISATSLSALEEYYVFNKENGNELKRLNKEIVKFKKTMPNHVELGIGGTKTVSKADIDRTLFDFKAFANSRYSIRDFEPGPVNDEIIKEAIEIAQKTPSVCNRHSWKVYSYGKEKDKSEILKYQNGNRGFGHLADKILIVTMDLRDFRGSIERNQAYIDGGMYSMSLIYALHSLGVGTCPLNLSIVNKTEKKLKEVTGIPDSEVFMMMIAVGHIPDKLKVAWSPRRDVDEVLTLN